MLLTYVCLYLYEFNYIHFFLFIQFFSSYVFVFVCSIAVQHERGPRNSTLRKHMALYLRDAHISPSSELVGHPISPGYSPHSPAYFHPFFGAVNGVEQTCGGPTMGPVNFPFHGVASGLNPLSLCQPVPRVSKKSCSQFF